jgi:hypothetical protein
MFFFAARCSRFVSVGLKSPLICRFVTPVLVVSDTINLQRSHLISCFLEMKMLAVLDICDHIVLLEALRPRIGSKTARITSRLRTGEKPIYPVIYFATSVPISPHAVANTRYLANA